MSASAQHADTPSPAGEAPAEAAGTQPGRLEVDLLVVGFGKAGKTLAMKRAAAGDRVALIEQDPAMYGGTCINIGCVPSKTLLTAAHRFAATAASPAAGAADAEGEQGGVVNPGREAFGAARQHRNAFIARLNQANLQMAQGKGVTVIDGRARFLNAHTVEVTGGPERLEVTGETVVINTGAEPVTPPLEGLADAEVAALVEDSTSVQQLDPRPDSLAILGGGPIGLEFATLFAQFGTRVTVIDGAERFLPRLDRDIADSARQRLEDMGVQILSGARARSVRRDGEGLSLEVAGADGDVTVTADRLLVAVGRRPRTEGLGLEEAGIAVGERGGVVVDERLRTSQEGVYAAGDVTGGPQFTYVSYDDHRIILADRWGEGGRTTEGRLIPTTTFLDPPLATVGMTEDEAREHVKGLGHELSVRAADIKDVAIMPRPKILGRPQGRAKFLVDASADRILGAALFCTDAQELINTVALAIRHEIPASAVGAGIYTHPSSSEIFNALLDE